jgi:hypothetical protein
MSMPDQSPSQMKPQDTTIFLLGGLNAKMDTVIVAQAGYDTRLRSVEAIVAGLSAHDVPKTPWYVIAGGLSGIGSLIGVGIFLLNYFSQHAV